MSIRLSVSEESDMKEKNMGQLIFYIQSNAYMKFQNLRIHGSEDKRGLKTVTYRQMIRQAQNNMSSQALR